MSLLGLPPEIIDSILAHIDRVTHLAAFALTSKECARHAIPRHTQYRIILTSTQSYPIWAHLASATSLARNVRQVLLLNKPGTGHLDRYPTSLVPPLDLDESAQDAEAKYMLALCRSLVPMDLLTTFVWMTPRSPSKEIIWEYRLLNILSLKYTHLRHLYLDGAFAKYTHGIRDDPESTKYPGWRFTNLTTLCLHGAEWITLHNAPHLERLLSRNPDLEHLDIPMEFPRLANCRFPRLKRLKLTLTAGALAHIDGIHIQFLSHHPTIQDLVWFPIGNDLALPPGFLPNLKRLTTDVSLAQALYANDTPDPTTQRSIECLNIRTLPPSLMDVLEQTPHDRTSLRTLRIHAIRQNDRLEQIPILFPNIVHLRFPNSVVGARPSDRFVFTMEGWLGLLPLFRSLQVFRGTGIWETLRQSQIDVDYREAMASVVRACPKLRELDHVTVDEERGEHMRLIVSRRWGVGINGNGNGYSADEESAGENEGEGKVLKIKYHVQRPKQISVFDIFSGAFND